MGISSGNRKRNQAQNSLNITKAISNTLSWLNTVKERSPIKSIPLFQTGEQKCFLFVNFLLLCNRTTFYVKITVCINSHEAREQTVGTLSQTTIISPLKNLILRFNMFMCLMRKIFYFSWYRSRFIGLHKPLLIAFDNRWRTKIRQRLILELSIQF